MGLGNMPQQPSQMGPAPIAPPSLLHGMSSTATAEAQIAASQRERARSLQIQQAVRQQQQQQQQQQQLQQQNARQMSPPAQRTSQTPGQGQQHHQGGGPSIMSNANINPAAATAAFGPNAMHNIQMLQNPSHPFMQYMAQNVPGFATLSVQQQLHRMHGVQVSHVLCSAAEWLY
jgi:multidrug efflux pump subunit AcrA (membrane-fusion protein)